MNANTILHFSPPAGILLVAETTEQFVGVPAGTTHPADAHKHQNRVSEEAAMAAEWRYPQEITCAAAFACTEYKVQAESINQVVHAQDRDFPQVPQYPCSVADDFSVR
ncbi:hypothetical protein F5883DRAFT_243334 [Diaporthe sp. PMI_573]|nr:hypothetical protein F5883DRAFT_243334 [Diaporthaceae sp. PMI_573]